MQNAGSERNRTICQAAVLCERKPAVEDAVRVAAAAMPEATLDCTRDTAPAAYNG